MVSFASLRMTVALLKPMTLAVFAQHGTRRSHPQVDADPTRKSLPPLAPYRSARYDGSGFRF
jgi:hypothetical protein